MNTLPINILARLRLRRDAALARRVAESKQVKENLQDAESIAKLQRATMMTNLQVGMDMLSITQMTRFAVQDISELMDPQRRDLGDILSLATTLVLVYYRILALQQIAKANQIGLLASLGLTGGGAIAAAVGVGALVGGAAIMGRRTTGSRAGETAEARRRLAALRARGG